MRPERPISFETALNLRDLGGWRTAAGGSVRHGLIYRSAALHRWRGDPRTILQTLAIRTCFDLRTTWEREAAEIWQPDGIEIIVVDVLGDSFRAGSPSAAIDPGHGDSELQRQEQNDARDRIRSGYRRFLSLSTSLDAYRTLFLELAHVDRCPALIHCTSGKDRTGWAAAALLLFLGVSENDVIDDYLLTNEALTAGEVTLSTVSNPAVGNGASTLPATLAHRDYLLAAIDEMNNRFGSIEGYFAAGLGLDATTQRTLRELLVEKRGTG